MPEPVSPLLETEQIQLLTQIGFIAAARADAKRAEVIFGALSRVRADRAFPHIGLAVAWLNAGRAATAVAHLRSVQLPEGDDQDLLQAFLGLALQLDSRAAEAERVLRAVAARTDAAHPSEGATLARRLLGESPSTPAAHPTSLDTLAVFGQR